MAHRYYQFFRPLPADGGTIAAIRVASAKTSNGLLPAIDIVLTGPGATTIGPILFENNALELPELFDEKLTRIAIDVLQRPDVRNQLATGSAILWSEHRSVLEEETRVGCVPGLSSYADEFAMATALRSARSLLSGRRVVEWNAPGYPWVQRLCACDASVGRFRDAAAQAARQLFGRPREEAFSPGDAVIVYDDLSFPDFELALEPLVWIGRADKVEAAAARLRSQYADVEQFGIVMRSEDYGFTTERSVAPINVLLVNSSSGKTEVPAAPEGTVAVSAPGTQLRLLLVARPDRSKYPIGGVETLLVKTSSLMRERGVVVDIAETLEPDASSYDVAHIIGGLADNVVPQGEAVRRSGKPLLITPIYATYEGMQWFNSGSLKAHSYAGIGEQERILDIMRRRIANIGGLPPQPGATDFRDLVKMQRGLALADLLLVCAEGEAREMAVRLGVYRPSALLPNGVDTNVMRPGVERIPLLPKRPYVLMATRIDAQKNVFGLFDATRNLDVDVVILGRVDHDFAQIAGMVMANAGRNVIFIPSVPTQQHPWFGSLFANAAAVAVMSWSEVFSLNVLDAAACGVPVVMGHGGYHAELFGDLGYYADPIDADSIRNAIEGALAEDAPTRARRMELAAHVQNTNNWNAVADRLLELYKQAAARGPVPLTGIR